LVEGFRVVDAPSLHDPTVIRPSWDCRRCAAPWPCPSARRELGEEFYRFPSVLTIYLSVLMSDALEDLRTVEEPVRPDIYRRFVLWARPVNPQSA
jgi:hypothetical protein